MTDVRVITTRGTDAIFEEAAIQELRPGCMVHCCLPATQTTAKPARSGTG